eukprot:1140244-Pelagomonas_calceolata.AAC.3
MDCTLQRCWCHTSANHAHAVPCTCPTQERVEYSAEVLVTRSDLDEKRNRMAELEQQVAELTMQTEYQLRLKDLHLQEKTKELTGEEPLLCACILISFPVAWLISLKHTMKAALSLGKWQLSSMTRSMRCGTPLEQTPSYGIGGKDCVLGKSLLGRSDAFAAWVYP